VKRVDKRKPYPRCGVCQHPHYTLSKAFDGRPQFRCVQCGNEWTCGKDGGEYMASKFLAPRQR